MQICEAFHIFLAVDNWKVKLEKQTNLQQNNSKNREYLRINLTKDVQDLHAENHRSLGHHPAPWPAGFDY